MQQQKYESVDNTTGEALYQRYGPTLFATLLRQTASREDAEDLLVEVFLAVLQHPALQTASEQEQRAWLWRVAHNKVVDHFRRFSRYSSVNLEQIEAMVYEDEALAPDQVILRQEEYLQLHTSLKELPPLQQEVLTLRFGHGLSCREMATVLQKSEGAVRMLLFRTLKMLRTIYKKPEHTR